MDLLSALPVSLRQLQYIVAVAEHGSFRRAADACHVAQPSLSAQVGVAEQALGVQLFERTAVACAYRRRRAARCAGAPDLMAAAISGSWRDWGRSVSRTLRLGVIPRSARTCCRHRPSLARDYRI